MHTIRAIIVLIGILFAQQLMSKDFKLVDLDHFDMTAAKFGDNRDPLTPDIAPHKYLGRVAVDYQVRLLEYFYWQNIVHTEGTEAQFQTVGWQWELGLKLTPQIQPFYQHHSRHRMDSIGPDGNMDGKPDGFPVEDSYGVRIHFYINENPQRSMFK